MDPKLIQAALDALINDDKEAAIEILKKLVVSAAGGTAESDGAPPPAELGASAENAEPTPEEQAMAAMSRELVTLSGRATPGEAATYFRELHATAAASNTDRAKLEANERRGLVAELVKLGVELPAHAWVRGADGEIPEGDARTPVKRLADEPIAEMRSRVDGIRKAKGGAPPAPRTPAGDSSERSMRKLSREELAYIKREGINEQEFHGRLSAAVRRV